MGKRTTKKKPSGKKQAPRPAGKASPKRAAPKNGKPASGSKTGSDGRAAKSAGKAAAAPAGEIGGALFDAVTLAANEQDQNCFPVWVSPKRLASLPACKRITEGTVQEQVAVALLAIEDLRRGLAHSRPISAPLLGVLLRKKLPLPAEHVCSLLAVATKMDNAFMSRAAIAGFLERSCKEAPPSAELIEAMRAWKEALVQAGDHAVSQRLTVVLEAAPKAAPLANADSKAGRTRASADPESVERGRAQFKAFRATVKGLAYELNLNDTPAGRAIANATREELVGVAAAAMDDFAPVAQPETEGMPSINLHFHPRYRKAVVDLLVRLFRKDLPHPPEIFEKIAAQIGEFSYITTLGCPHFAAFVGALEKYAARAGVSPALAESLYRIEAGLRNVGRADEGRLANRVLGVLKQSAATPHTATESSPLHRALLRRESLPAFHTPSLVEQLSAALVLPDENDQRTSARFDLSGFPRDGSALEAINSMFASVPTSYAASEQVDAIAGAAALELRAIGSRGVAVAAAALAVLSHRQMKLADVRSMRFHNGIQGAHSLLRLALDFDLGSDSDSLAELCDALSRYRDCEYLILDTRHAAERIAAAAAPLLPQADDRLLLALLRFRERVARMRDSHWSSAVGAFDERLGVGPGFPTELGERWADRAYTDVHALPREQRDAWLAFLRHCAVASGSQPSAKWLKHTDELLTAIPAEQVQEHLGVWFALVGKPRPAMPGAKVEGRDSSVPSDRGADVLRGLAWAASRFDSPRMAGALGDLAMACYKMVPGVGARCIKPGTSAIWSLSQMRSPEALGQLSRVRQLVKFGTAKKLLDSSLQKLARQLNLTVDELHEISVPDFGLSRAGVTTEDAGEFTLKLSITGSESVLRILDEDGRERKSVPEAVKKAHKETLKAMQQASADIDKMLAAQRDRLERLYHDARTWPAAVWRARYLEHPLVGAMARRLIWSFTRDGRTTEAMLAPDAGTDEKPVFIDDRGKGVEVSDGDAVALWHPVSADPSRVQAWRAFLEDRRIRQPFKQAHREIYVLTDAERTTRIYSNRFAAHILKQGQFNALCQTRGWKHSLFVMDSGEPPLLHLPRWDLFAQYLVLPIGDDTYGSAGAYAYLQTDQVRFCRTPRGDNIPLEDIPPLPFSEVMRDVDLFVGVASVGNNPEWEDGGPDGAFRSYWWSYGFGDLAESGNARREMLARLLPRLRIAAACELGERFLTVRGKLRTYKIHLGSGNILMSPNDQYLCIVPGPVFFRGGGDAAGQVFLPFEGDRPLAIILSKAFMLAEDDQIQDPSITRQIKSR